jgi:DNA-binding LacI/PurR family transcriptional regulator
VTKRPTLADVAARAGVSVALVSIAMRGAKGVSAATSEQIFKAAQEIGYRPDTRARLLRSRRSRLLGVQFGLPHPFHADLVESLYAVAEPAGYQLALSAVAASRSEQRATEALLDDRCEALILLGPQAPVARLEKLAGVLDVFLRAGVDVPGQLSVIGFDDSRLVRLTHINLTTIGQDIPRLADLAVVRALARLEGQDAPGTETVIAPRLIVRGTTAAP